MKRTNYIKVTRNKAGKSRLLLKTDSRVLNEPVFVELTDWGLILGKPDLDYIGKTWRFTKNSVYGYYVALSPLEIPEGVYNVIQEDDNLIIEF